MAPLPVEELALLDLERSNKGASKQRRDQINGEISTMRDLLPLPESARQRLSQLQIMSLSCVYIRKCNILQKMLPADLCSIEVPCEFSSALTGFILVTTQDGKLVYISENVTEYLGHSMVDMKTQGDSLFDIVDKRDHGTVQAQLLHGVGNVDGQYKRKVSFLCQMNMSRTLKRQGGFGDVKVMHVKGHFVPVIQKESGTVEHNVFMALCTPLITPDVKESLIQNNTTVFKSVHKLDMSFIEITETGEFHLGMTTEQIHNQSWYSMIHPEDLTEARTKHIQLIKSRHEMGCMLTLRMLTNDHNEIWLNIVMHVRQALVSNSDDPVIVCINQVVSEEEAKQFKIQEQLFALYSSRAPDLFFGAHHFPHLHHVDPEIMGRQQAEVYMHQQQAYFAEQQRYQYAPVRTQPTCYLSPQNQYQLSGMELVCQQPQGHTSTIRALKRKLQENFISNCKPNKMQRVISGDIHDDGLAEAHHPRDTQYIMNVDVFRSSLGVNQTMNGSNTGVSFASDTLPVVYQTAAIDPLQAIRQKKAMIMHSTAHVRTPAVIQKLHSTCTSLEQVVPDVSIPDCYLTPDASPVSSPKPMTTATVKRDTNEIRQLTNYITNRLNELKQSRMINKNSVVKSNGNIVRQKLLPVIDAIFVDSFFDDFKPTSKRECMDIKFEPISTTPTVQVNQQQRLACVRAPVPSAMPTIGKSLPQPPCMLPMRSSACTIKEELSLEDCTDLEKLFGFVETAGLDNNILSPESIVDVSSPAASPESANNNNNFSEYSPVSPPFGAQPCIKHPLNLEASPGSNSPIYDGRNDILDPDNWLLEPISLSLDMALPDLDVVPCDVKSAPHNQDLYHFKQLLQHSWEPNVHPAPVIIKQPSRFCVSVTYDHVRVWHIAMSPFSSVSV